MAPEWICLGVDAATTTLFYWMYRRSNESAMRVKEAKRLELNNTLESVLKVAEGECYPYALIEGVAEAADKPLESLYTDEKGLIQSIELTERRAKWSDGSWSDTAKVLKSTTRHVRMKLVNNDDPLQTCVHVDDPLQAKLLPMYTTYDHFEPSKSSLWERSLDRLFGEVTKGVHETESMLKVGTSLVGIGKISIEDNKIRLQAPSISGAKYILSNLSRSEIITSLESQGRMYKALVFVFGMVGVGIGAYIAYKWYRLWKETQEFAQLQERRAQQRANRNNEGNYVEGVDGHDQACVICLANARDVVLLDCGHVCVCAECADILPRPRKCPVCRRRVERIVPTFVS